MAKDSKPAVSPSRQRLIATLDKHAARRRDLLEAIENGFPLTPCRCGVKEPKLWEERHY